MLPSSAASSTGAIFSAPETAAQWAFECVDCPKHFTDLTDRSLRLDHNGNPHIVYGGENLYYAWHDGTSWNYDTVDNSLNAGRYASLALDSIGYPHILYHHIVGISRVDLKYARLDHTGWHTETVVQNAHSGYTSIAIDENNNPHLSYFDSFIYALIYVYQDPTGWQTETVDSDGYVGYGCSIALDETGQSHISYIESSVNDLLKYAQRGNTGWQIELVENIGISNLTSLALDQHGDPHISYQANSRLRYTVRGATGWLSTTIDGRAGAGRYHSIALDQNGYPHIGYSGVQNEGLLYATLDASG
jgi:hypothetical protein